MHTLVIAQVSGRFILSPIIPHGIPEEPILLRGVV